MKMKALIVMEKGGGVLPFNVEKRDGLKGVLKQGKHNEYKMCRGRDSEFSAIKIKQ